MIQLNKAGGKMKKIVLSIFLCILVIGSIYYYNEEYKNIAENKKTKENKKDLENENVYNSCPDGYECIELNGVTYKFSIKKSIEVKDMFNYDTNENVNGTLKIDDNGVLIFVSENNEIIRKYDYISSNVIKIDSTNDKCDPIYVILTSDGKVYKTEIEDGLFTAEPFFELQISEKIYKISLYNETCDVKLIGLNENYEVKDLLSND